MANSYVPTNVRAARTRISNAAWGNRRPTLVERIRDAWASRAVRRAILEELRCGDFEGVEPASDIIANAVSYGCSRKSIYKSAMENKSLLQYKVGVLACIVDAIGKRKPEKVYNAFIWAAWGLSKPEALLHEIVATDAEYVFELREKVERKMPRLMKDLRAYERGLGRGNGRDGK